MKEKLEIKKIVKMLKEPDTEIMIIGKYDGEDDVFSLDKGFLLDLFAQVKKGEQVRK